MGLNQPFCKQAVALALVLAYRKQDDVLPDSEHMVTLPVEEQWYPGMLEDPRHSTGHPDVFGVLHLEYDIAGLDSFCHGVY